VTPNPPTGPITPPRVTSIRATIKAPAARGRFTVVEAAWLPTEGWFCGGPCDHPRNCGHIRAVRDQVTW
jgi:hypothetical protein